MNFKELFINKSKTLIVNTDLAMVLGDLNEAIVLNQLNYWLEINKKADKNFLDGKYWVYNSYGDWRANDFPYWSEKTIQRTFSRLESKGVVVSANYNKASFDKTKWYTIDEKALQKLVDNYDNDNVTDDEDKLSRREGQIDRPIPEITNKDYDSCNSLNRGNNYNSVSPEESESNESQEEQKAAEERMISRAGEIVYGWDGDKELADNAKSFLGYFLKRHRECTGKYHCPLTNKVLIRVLDALTKETIIERDGYKDIYFEVISKIDNDDDYKMLVDEYFNTKFSAKCDYSLAHFSSQNVLINIMNHVGKNTWCESIGDQEGSMHHFGFVEHDKPFKSKTKGLQEKIEKLEAELEAKDNLLKIKNKLTGDIKGVPVPIAVAKNIIDIYHEGDIE